jgi:hypothetical protein
MWIRRTIDDYDFRIKQYCAKSKFGIDEGRISKLEIWKDGELLSQYDRGWVKKPRSAKVKAVFEEILRQHN